MNKILIYIGNQNIDLNKLQEVIQQFTNEFSYIDDTDMDVKMIELLEKENKKAIQGKEDAFLYIESRDVEELQNLDKELDEQNIQIERKAIKTENNVDWTLRELLNEVREEFEYFQLKDKLYALITSPNKEKLNTDPIYLRTMTMAFSLLQDDEVDKNTLKMAIESIEKFEN